MVKQLGIEELAQTSPLEESELTALNELLEFDFSQFDRPEGEESEDSVIVKIKLEFTPEQYEFFKEKSADLAGKTISEKILRLIGYEG